MEIATRPSEACPPGVVLRPPRPDDAAGIWALVDSTPSLDTNSPYAYLLLCSHFADTAVVAEADGRLAGFVVGYARPDDGQTAFVWQVGVSPDDRGRGLGLRLLNAWFARCARRFGSRFLEATVTPSNRASHSLFRAFADRHGVRMREQRAYSSDLFPDCVPHEDELSLRIGPVSLARAIYSNPEIQ